MKLTARYAATLSIAVLACAAPLGSLYGQQETPGARPAASVEEIYVFRSIRDSRVPPTEFCSKEKSGVAKSLAEDQFSLWSIVSEGANGRVVKADAQKIGGMHTCIGPTPNPAVTEFYIDTTLQGHTFRGLGECQVVAPDFPEKGLAPVRCSIRLTDVPDGYVGGLVTSNTMFSATKPLGVDTDPPGYMQSSVAVLRLWKKR